MYHAATNGRNNGVALGRISTGIVQLYARYWGKGPPRVKAHIAGDLVVCVLQDPYTTLERTLLDADKVETVQGTRDKFGPVMEADSRRIVEESCGRRVIACLAATHVDPDIAVEVFVLEALGPDALAPDVSSAAGNGLRG